MQLFRCCHQLALCSGLVVCAMDENGYIQLWDVTTGKLIVVR